MELPENLRDYLTQLGGSKEQQPTFTVTFCNRRGDTYTLDVLPFSFTNGMFTFRVFYRGLTFAEFKIQPLEDKVAFGFMPNLSVGLPRRKWPVDGQEDISAFIEGFFEVILALGERANQVVH